MALTDYKIASADYAEKDIASCPDKLTGTAAENKALFDRLVKQLIATKLNALIDALTADNIPASGAGSFTGSTIQAIIDKLPALAAHATISGYSKGSDTALSAADTLLVALGKLEAQIAAMINHLKGDPGDPGAPGKSAYEAATEGGYTGSEADFYSDLAAMQGLATDLAAI